MCDSIALIGGAVKRSATAATRWHDLTPQSVKLSARGPVSQSRERADTFRVGDIYRLGIGGRA